MDIFGFLTGDQITLESSQYDNSISHKTTSDIFSITETSKETKAKRDNLLYKKNRDKFIKMNNDKVKNDPYYVHQVNLDKEKTNSRMNDAYANGKSCFISSDGKAIDRINNRSKDEKYKDDENKKRELYRSMTKVGSKIKQDKESKIKHDKDWQNKMRKSASNYYESGMLEDSLNNIEFK